MDIWGQRRRGKRYRTLPYWHRDHGAGWSGEAWPYPRERSLKVSVYLYDVPDDGGCLTFVPGSR